MDMFSPQASLICEMGDFAKYLRNAGNRHEDIATVCETQPRVLSYNAVPLHHEGIALRHMSAELPHGGIVGESKAALEALVGPLALLPCFWVLLHTTFSCRGLETLPEDLVLLEMHNSL